MQTTTSAYSATATTITPSRQLSYVLRAVRDTGQSAHPTPGHKVSGLVICVAVMYDMNPGDLQREVNAWAAYHDALAA
jgi:hypothetical protein